MRFYHSTYTNIAFPAFMIAVGAPLVTIIGATLLAIGSAGFHWYEHIKWQISDHEWLDHIGYKWQKADEIGMYIYFLSIVWALGGQTYTMLGFGAAMALYMGLKHRRFDSETVGLLAGMAIYLKSGETWMAVIPLAGFLLALWIRGKGEAMHRNGNHKIGDLIHGWLWHLLAAGSGALIIWV